MRKLLTGLAVLIALVVIAAALGTLVPHPFFNEVATNRTEPYPRRILVLANPIHTDIALRLDPDIISAFGFLEDAGIQLHHPDAQWLIFGWGGRAFTWKRRPGPI